MPDGIKQKQFVVDSILGGISSLYNDGSNGFTMAIGIDPEVLLSGSVQKSTGTIVPTVYKKFSTSVSLTSYPMWMTGAQTTGGVFVYGADGTVSSYSNVQTLEYAYGNPTAGAGNGMAYYNDYIYLATPTDISRLGRISLTAPTVGNTYWTGTLGLTALTNSVYPTVRNIVLPNHPLHFHNDGNLYIGDYDGSNGQIHYLNTASDGTGGTGKYSALKLPFGMMPTDIDSYGTDLAILCTSQIDVGQQAQRPGDGALFLWDTISQNFYRMIPIKEGICSAMCNKNGELHITAGNIDAGYKLLKYLGGYSFEVLVVMDEGSPPPAGAMDVNGNMVAFGNYGSYPTVYAGVMGYGFRSGKINSASLNNIARISNTSDSLPQVSVVRFIQRNRFPIIGWATADSTSNFGLDQYTDGITYAARFLTDSFSVGQHFCIRRVRVAITNQVASGTSITPTVYVDDYQGVTQTLTTINSTNYSGSDRLIDFRNLSIEGYNNFLIDFSFTGTDKTGIDKITIDVDVYD